MTPLQAALNEGRLTNHAWSRTYADGRTLLCALSAMSPEVQAEGDPNACPAHVCPTWLAHLVPWMTDEGSKEARPALWARLADLQARWVALWPEGWPPDVSRRCDYGARAVVLREVLPGETEYDLEGLLAEALALVERTLVEGPLPEGEVQELLGRARHVDRTLPNNLHALLRRYAASIMTSALEPHKRGAVDAARCAVPMVKGKSWREHGDMRAGLLCCDRLTTAILDLVEREVDAAEVDLLNRWSGHSDNG